MYKVVTDADSGAVQAERDLTRRILTHRGERSNVWEVTCTTWQHAERKRDSIHTITTTEVPDLCYIISVNIISSANAQFLQLLPKITGQQQKSTVIIKGAEYDLKDFRVRIGRVYEKQNPTHVVVEVEYRPCVVVDECASLLQDFLDLFLRAPSRRDDASQMEQTTYHASRVLVDYRKTILKEKDIFSLKHAACLYVKLLTSG